MLKTLIKKQFLELNRSFFQNQKTGKKRSTVSVILMILLMVGVLALLGGVFFYLGDMICEPLVKAGMGWLYFVVMGMMSVVLGVFGSVFNTFASLYQAKDNDLLLSMPVPVSHILVTRLFGVYFMGLLYSAVIMVPTLIVYYMVVTPGIVTIICSVVLMIMLSIFVLVLSCILGWGVAKISSRLKNKSIVTVIVSLAFLIGYYYVYFRSYEMLQKLVANSQIVGVKVRNAAYPLYLLGRAGEGDVSSTIILSAMVLALFAVVYFVLSRSFLKIVISSTGTSRVKYREKMVRQKSVESALLSKEMGRFLSSATYMLNCALGTLMLVFAAGVILVKGDWIREVIMSLGIETGDLVPMLFCVSVCCVVSMNDITAPSVSLEGKNVWIAQSLPITSWQVLCAKIKLHLLLTEIPALLCSLCAVIILRPSLFMGFMMVLIPLLFGFLGAVLGLAMNLKMPNLNWTSETAAVKQSVGVILTMFINWGIVAILCIVYYGVNHVIRADIYMILCALVIVACAVGLLQWIKHRGTRIFELLS